MEFNLEKFNPTIAELTELADSYKWLEIAWIEDKEWYEIVKKAQLDLRDKRNYIQETLKKYRQDAIDFQKAVIKQENELVSIIEWTEQELKSKRKKIDDEIEIEKRKKILPDRRAELERNWITTNWLWEILSDDYILDMDSNKFNEFVLRRRETMLLEKEQRLLEEQNKIKLADRKKRLAEVWNITMSDWYILWYKDDEFDKRIEEEKEIVKNAEKKAEDKLKLEQQQKEEKEKQRLIDEENTRKAEQEKLQKKTKYQKWLKDNDYQPDDHIANDWTTAILYRKISTFTL